MRKFRDAITSSSGVLEISKRMYEALKNGKKAEFALDVLEAEKFEDLAVPSYIAEGLEWLLNQLKKKQVEILPQDDQPEPSNQSKQVPA